MLFSASFKLELLLVRHRFPIYWSNLCLARASNYECSRLQ